MVKKIKRKGESVMLRISILNLILIMHACDFCI